MRISHMMDNLQDDTVNIRIMNMASAERIKEAAMSKIYNDTKIRKSPRLLLIAAVVAMALCLSAFTLWQLSFKNMPGPEENTLIMSGLTGMPEYEAAMEWEKHVKAWFEAGENMAEPGMEGDIYTQNQAISPKARETLDAILEKYGLRMHEVRAYTKSLDMLYGEAGISGFMPEQGESGEAPTGGAYYADGSFSFNGTALMPGGDSVRYTLYSFKKGSFTRTSSLLADTEGFEEWLYASDGTQVLLGLGATKSAMVVDLENCFVFVNILSGRENSDESAKSYGWPAVDKAALEEFAAGFDFNVINSLCE